MIVIIDFEPQRKKYESSTKKYFTYFVNYIVLFIIIAISEIGNQILYIA